jgi:adenylate cyclase
MIPVTVQIPLALGWAILFNSIRSFVETEFLKQSLALYLSPQQVKQILRDPALLKPGVSQRHVSILFSDIASFSKISERMAAADLAKLLNDYYETAISCIHETGGTIMNLIGDAILAIWNAPQDQADHPERACRAAVLLSQKLIVFDSTRRSLRLQTRVGLHAGDVSVGNIGSSRHFDYTVIGENVNLASRLEGLNKHLGTSVLATREIQRTVEGKMPTRLVGHFRFKGLDQVVEVHELIIAEGEAASAGQWIDAFGCGLHYFQRMDFEQAAQHFRVVLGVKPNDGPSTFYLKKIDEFRGTPPASEWFGEIDMREK